MKSVCSKSDRNEFRRASMYVRKELNRRQKRRNKEKKREKKSEREVERGGVGGEGENSPPTS